MERGEVKRVRLWFENGKILKKSQRREGLKLSWILLKPSYDTVSDISSYIYRTFHLHRSCPHGIILTMDGFVLPPFESACILKDTDVIRVKRKGKLLSRITNVDDGENLINDEEVVEKKAILTSVPLLANEEFEMESDGYLSEPDKEEEEEEEEQQEKHNQSGDGSYEEKSPDRNKISKKRKASKKLGSSKKKKKKKTIMDLQPSDQMQAITTLLNVHQNASNGFPPGESSDTKKNISKVKKKRKRASTIVSNDDTSQPLPSPQRSSPIQENDIGCGVSSQVPAGTEKKPSRSARRKKAKRQWLREIVEAEKELLLHSNGTSSQLGTSDAQLKRTQSPEVGVNKQSVEHQHLQNQNCEADNQIAPDADVVPIVIRPGHIRFEPLEEDEEGLQQRHISAEIVQWNGITNKKKGQKWGSEKSTFWRNESQNFNKEVIETVAIEEVKPPNDSIDFDNLAPLARLPKEGDLIAYRLVELSSTWTPELTSFRVGKTSWYDSGSNKILLTPLPEYPIVIEKQDEEDTFAQPPNNSFYEEDGSLEIDFSSLVDVRMVKESDSDPAEETSDGSHAPLMSNGANSSITIPSENGRHDSTLHSEKQENAWDEISEALNAKKAELVQENGWTKENSGKGKSSFRPIRGSAIGPIIARLRANNEI